MTKAKKEYKKKKYYDHSKAKKERAAKKHYPRPQIDYSINDEMCDVYIPAFLQHSYINGNPPPVITTLRSWQRGLLSRQEWEKGKNCVVVAPTSGGKTLVAEVSIAQLLEDDPLAKIIYTLPFVALASEKNADIQQRFKRYLVRPFYQNVGGSDFQRGSIAICTYEKAHSILNSAIKNHYISKIKLVIIDEVHMIGDGSRGVVCESLIMKLMALPHKPRIITLTATLNKFDAIKLSQSINGFFHFTTIRSAEIKQYISTWNGTLLKIKDNELVKILTQTSIKEDTFFILPMVRTVLRKATLSSVIIFVNTRLEAKKLAIFISKHLNDPIEKVPPTNTPTPEVLQRRKDILHDLSICQSGADPSLSFCIENGIAFHHAGLLLEERKIVERGVKDGSIQIVVATTTLSAGVNIRNVSRVIIYSPYRKNQRQKEMISTSLFAQMSGRSGRVEGRDGDVIVIARSTPEIDELKQMMTQPLPNVESSILKTTQIYSYVLQTLTYGLSRDFYSLKSFMMTSFCYTQKDSSEVDALINKSVDYLTKNKLINNKFITTKIGNAISASNLTIEEGLKLNDILEKMMKSLCLIDDLHLLFLCSPQQTGVYVPSFKEPIWESIFEKHSHVIYLITDKTIDELRRIIVFSFNGRLQMDSENLSIFERIYTACVLECLIDEMSLSEIEKKYNIERGTIQSLQTNASSYTGQVTRFVESMEFLPLAAALQQFIKRLSFGVRNDLVELMRLPSMRREIARKLFDKGIKEPKDLVMLSVDEIYGKICSEKVDENVDSSSAASSFMDSIQPDENDVVTDQDNKKKADDDDDRDKKDIMYIVKNLRKEAKELTDNLAILEEYEEKATINAQNNYDD